MTSDIPTLPFSVNSVVVSSLVCSSLLHYIGNGLSMLMCSLVCVPSQLGPSAHSVLPTNSLAYCPLEGISAGLSSPGQFFQFLTSTCLLISCALFYTNGFHALSLYLLSNVE